LRRVASSDIETSLSKHNLLRCGDLIRGCTNEVDAKTFVM
jgi:hypothetical protein